MTHPRDAHRILIAGVSGAGKSTLARRISNARGLPYTELDSLHHGPGWQRLDSFDANVAAIAAGEHWISEWQYREVRPVLAARADLLVWLDLPTALVMSRVIRRTYRRSVTNEELWNGNREPGMWHAITQPEGIIRWAWQSRHKLRRTMPTLGADYPDLTVIRLRTPREVEAFAAGFTP